MKTFDVLLRVSDKNLSTVLACLAGAADLIKVEASAEPVSEPEGPRSRYLNGKKDKGIHGETLVLKVLVDRAVHTAADLQKAFEANGFAPHSYSASVSRLVKAGKVQRVGDKLYALSAATALKAANLEAARRGA